MAVSPAALNREPKKIEKILLLGSDLLCLARTLSHFKDAEILHIYDREALLEEGWEKFDPDLVVCTAECFRSLLNPPAKEPGNAPHLTPRRREMAELVSKGLSNTEIARVMGISQRSVRGEMSTLLVLFEASNRTELAAMIAKAIAA
jgi:DNA-binding NarL/FixJ family response regulator